MSNPQQRSKNIYDCRIFNDLCNQDVTTYFAKESEMTD